MRGVSCNCAVSVATVLLPEPLQHTPCLPDTSPHFPTPAHKPSPHTSSHSRGAALVVPAAPAHAQTPGPAAGRTAGCTAAHPNGGWKRLLRLGRRLRQLQRSCCSCVRLWLKPRNRVRGPGRRAVGCGGYRWVGTGGGCRRGLQERNNVCVWGRTQVFVKTVLQVLQPLIA